MPARGVSHAHYYSEVLALYGTKYLDIARGYPQFLLDCAAGTLPSVSFLDPKFNDEGTGTSADDHPHADIRAEQHFLNEAYEAITSSPTWPRTARVVNYDEWGGFYDHVVPATAPDARPDLRAELRAELRGFRTPALLVSPRARRAHVDHTVCDHTSVLKMIEWRWGLDPLTPRDAAASNLAQTLDFGHAPNVTAPRWAVRAAVGLPCLAGDYVDYEDWNALSDLATAYGWRTGPA